MQIFQNLTLRINIDTKDDSYLQGRRQGGGAWGASSPPPQFLTDQLTLSQPGGADYAHHSTTRPPKFSDLATGLVTHLSTQTNGVDKKITHLDVLK